MATLVTGSGLIGSQAARSLLEQGESVILYDLSPMRECISDIVNVDRIKIIRGNILDSMDLLRTIRVNDVDKITHTAALLTMDARGNPYGAAKVNIEGTLNVLEAARIMDIERVVFTSSSWVYFGSSADLDHPISEDFSFNFISGRPPHIYATSKIASEYLCFNYLDLYGVDFVTVRFAATFGPWRGPTTSIPMVFYKKTIDELLKIGSVVIDESYHPWLGGMDFTYSKDAGRGVALAVFAKTPKNRVYNVAMGRLYSLKDVIDGLGKLMPGARINIKSSEITTGTFTQNQPTDLSKAREEIGFTPRYYMEDALKDYVNFAKANL